MVMGLEFEIKGYSVHKWSRMFAVFVVLCLIIQWLYKGNLKIPQFEFSVWRKYLVTALSSPGGFYEVAFGVRPMGYPHVKVSLIYNFFVS